MDMELKRTMSLLIKGGEIVTAEERHTADILCEDEQITRIGKGLEPPDGDTVVVDATGKYVFPGFIDPHVHVFLPAMGTFAKDDYETASQAALMGGTTCFMEFILPARDEAPLAAYDTWQSKGAGHSACDYSFHMAVTRYDDEVEEELRQIVELGIPSFKVHLAYKDVLGIDDHELYATLGLARELGAITMGHCENAEIIEALRRQFVAEGRRGPEWHYHTRPPAVEAEGTHHLLTFAEIQKAPVYVAHLSCQEALAAAEAAKRRGVPVWIETLIQFLLLDRTYAEKPGFEGAKYIMSPPLRDKSNHAPLWTALSNGLISTVSTDHAPFDFIGQKDQGRHDFTRIPGGLPGIEDRVNLLYTYGVLRGRLDIHRFVDAASTQAARLFGLYPRKGTIRPGSDADLVVYDPHYEGQISSRTHAMNVDYSAYEGWPVKGRADTVSVRGTVVVRSGKFVGSFKHGRFVPRPPTHF